MVQQLTYYQTLGKVKSFTVPDGGMAMWVELNQSSKLLTGKAASNSIFIQQEGQFLVDSTQSRDRFIRLGFAGMSTDKIALGLQSIFE